MIKVLLLLALAGGIKLTNKPYHVFAAYTALLAAHPFLSSTASLGLTAGVFALHLSLAALFAFLVTRLLHYAQIDAGLFWWIVLVLVIFAGII